MAIALRRPTEGWRIKPAYTYPQAARLVGTSTSNVRRWVLGYEQPGHHMKPVFSNRGEPEEPAVSFLDLVEIAVVIAFRSRHVKLERMRRAHAYAAARFGLEYPFATLQMKTNGRAVLLDFQQEEPGQSFLVAISDFGQLTLPGDVAETVNAFDFIEEDQWAVRWFPAGHTTPVVVDPQRGAGKLTVLDRGVTVEAVYRRWKAKQPLDAIAREYKLRPEVVEDVVRFAATHRLAA